METKDIKAPQRISQLGIPCVTGICPVCGFTYGVSFHSETKADHAISPCIRCCTPVKFPR